MRVLARIQGACKASRTFAEAGRRVAALLSHCDPRLRKATVRLKTGARGRGPSFPILVRGTPVAEVVLDTRGRLRPLEEEILRDAAACLARVWEREHALPRDGAATRALHVGEALDETIDPVVYPLFSSVNYNFAASADLEAYLADQESGYLYTRWGNPTVRAVEEKVRALEGAEDCAAAASGMGAIACAVLSLVSAGDEVVAMRGLYGGTHHLFTDLLPRFGVRVRLHSHEEFRDAARLLRRKTRLCYFEPVTNPTLRVTDPGPVAEACRRRGIVSMVDNTFATPCNLRAIDAGIDLVAHSGTKYLSGHSDVLCGVVSGTRARIRAVRETMRLVGATMSPWDAFLLSRGLKTFAARMERHSANALRLARHLDRHPRVRAVLCPGLPSHPDHAVARRVLAAPGGMVTIRVAGGLDGAKRFVDSLCVFQRAASLGSVESLASIPVLTSHWGLSARALAEAGVTPDMVRLSVGIEDPKDLLADLDQALASAGQRNRAKP